MSRRESKSQNRSPLMLVLAVGWLAAPALAAGPPVRPPAAKGKPVHTLAGVVVDRAGGKPVAGATVAMAAIGRGGIMFQDDGTIRTYGPEETFFLFFSKTNGKTACEAVTDDEGRFTLKQFASLTARQVLAVAHADGGMALLTHVVPKDHQAEPLRITLDEPAYVSGVRPKLDSQGKSYDYVSLDLARSKEPKADDPYGADETEPGSSVHFLYSGFGLAARDSRKFKFGPLPPGHRYVVTQYYSTDDLGSPAIFNARWVSPKAGQRCKVDLNTPDGTEMSGRLTGESGQLLANVNVMIRSAAADGMIVGTISDKKGRYTLRGLPPGLHRLDLIRYAVRSGPG